MPDSIRVRWEPKAWMRKDLPTNQLQLYGGKAWLAGKGCISSTPAIMEVSLGVADNVYNCFQFNGAYRLTHGTSFSDQKVAAKASLLDTSPSVDYSTSLLGVNFNSVPSFIPVDRTLGTIYMTSTSHGLLKLTGYPPTGPSDMIQVPMRTGGHRITRVVRHLSRLVGISPGSSSILWSAAGDWDNWLSGTSGVNSLILADDELVDIHVVGNVIVLLCRRSIHFMYITGLVDSPYRLEQQSGETDVIAKDTAATRHGTTLYWTSNVACYKFENYQQVRIDTEQACNLFNQNQYGAWRLEICHVLRTVGNIPAVDRIVEDTKLILMSETSDDILWYDLKSGLWGSYYQDHIVRTDDSSQSFAWKNIVHNLMAHFDEREAPKFITDPGATLRWVENSPSEVGSVAGSMTNLLESPIIQVGEPDEEYTLDRIVMQYSISQTGAPTALVEWACKVWSYCSYDVSGGTGQQWSTNSSVNTFHTQTRYGDNQPAYRNFDLRDNTMTGQFYRFFFEMPVRVASSEYTYPDRHKLNMDVFYIDFYFTRGGSYGTFK